MRIYVFFVSEQYEEYEAAKMALKHDAHCSGLVESVEYLLRLNR
jgi:hypothetical protein